MKTKLLLLSAFLVGAPGLAESASAQGYVIEETYSTINSNGGACLCDGNRYKRALRGFVMSMPGSWSCTGPGSTGTPYCTKGGEQFRIVDCVTTYTAPNGAKTKRCWLEYNYGAGWVDYARAALTLPNSSGQGGSINASFTYVDPNGVSFGDWLETVWSPAEAIYYVPDWW